MKAQIARGIARIYIHKGNTLDAYKYLEEALYFCHLTSDRELRVMVELDLGLLFEACFEKRVGAIKNYFFTTFMPSFASWTW